MDYLDKPKLIQSLNGLSVWYVPTVSDINPLDFEWVLFDAKVFVTPHYNVGLILGEVYLGGCVSSDYDEIIGELDFVIDDAMAEAKKELESLKALEAAQ
jgi:hypothetical protein